MWESQELRYQGPRKAVHTSLPRPGVKFCLPTLGFLMGRTDGKNGFLSMRMKIHLFFFSCMTGFA